MKNLFNEYDRSVLELAEVESTIKKNITLNRRRSNKQSEILLISSYPPRECGIATYSQDLIVALNNKFHESFTIRICPLESDTQKHEYSEHIKYLLNTDHIEEFETLADNINADPDISIVLIQHEFGLYGKNADAFGEFLESLQKPIVTVFHTVLPHPGETLRCRVQRIADASQSVIVMTHISEGILVTDYDIKTDKIQVIAHGTHLVKHTDKELLKAKYDLSGKKILSTFGLLSSGKNIETTLNALPEIVKADPDVLFLIIGKTHPSVIKEEGEKYREMLEVKVIELEMQQHVLFINQFLPLQELLEYLQLTDIYLFTSKDPNQAVSGTFSYAISCGCPVISTPIPHAREVLQNDCGIIVDFENVVQVTKAVISLLTDDERRKNISSNGLHSMASTAWENSAIAHAKLFEKVTGEAILEYTLPPLNLDHLKKMTTDFGMIQFSKLNQPDIHSGYTLDDNARALVAICQHFELTADKDDLYYMATYLNFIDFCRQPGGNFLNYVNEAKEFTSQNLETNLEDSNGRAIWALGYLVSIGHLLPEAFAETADSIMLSALYNVNEMHSTRAMAFVIKGLYYNHTATHSTLNIYMIRKLANRLVQMYRHESTDKWQWFESYLTYANSILPEAMLCAWLATEEPLYKEIAKKTFDFLLSKTFQDNSIKVISNKGWLYRENESVNPAIGGEQPIDVAYTILALRKFHNAYPAEYYSEKLKYAFNWFLGDNNLHQVIYNPCTGGCYDGLEENYVNLNQGAESTLSYLMARLAFEKTILNTPVVQLLSEPISMEENQVLFA